MTVAANRAFPAGVAELASLGRLPNEQPHIQLQWFGARPAVQRTKRVPSLVCTMVCLCNWLWPSGWVENDFVVNVARGHGRSVST